MNKRNDMIVEWAVKKIEREYKDDVNLLLTYGSYENGTANPLSDVDFYFIPKTEHSYELCKTFIVEGLIIQEIWSSLRKEQWSSKRNL